MDRTTDGGKDGRREKRVVRNGAGETERARQDFPADGSDFNMSGLFLRNAEGRAVSAFFSVAVYEVIFDSDSPGPELQPRSDGQQGQREHSRQTVRIDKCVMVSLHIPCAYGSRSCSSASM